MECKLKWHKDTIIVGDVVAASVDEELIHGGYEERQSRLRQMLFLGGWKYGKIGHIGELPHKAYDSYLKRYPFRADRVRRRSLAL